MRVKTIEWKNGAMRIVDQTKLPGKLVYKECRTPGEAWDAIKRLEVRGAPAIGIAGAMGVLLGIRGSRARTFDRFFAELRKVADYLGSSRPTAVNLFWAVERMKGVYARARSGGVDSIRAALVRESVAMHAEDVAANRAMGRFGQELVPDGARILTHCNAGALATAGYGTALGVIRAAVEAGKRVSVYADETRPFLQGARLTAWELQRDAIPVTVITDNMAGHFMHLGKIDCVVVGADRIAANGDVANKIGTYSVAVLAKENGVPFYVAAPVSTLDLSIPDGGHIPIEERDADEVRRVAGVPVPPEGLPVANPAFDVTPHAYVHAIVTERGIARPPFNESLKKLAGGGA